MPNLRLSISSGNNNSRDVHELHVGEVVHECAVGCHVAGAAVVLDDLRGDVTTVVDGLGEAGGGGAPTAGTPEGRAQPAGRQQRVVRLLPEEIIKEIKQDFTLEIEVFCNVFPLISGERLR